jgi:hypothetical protein
MVQAVHCAELSCYMGPRISHAWIADALHLGECSLETFHKLGVECLLCLLNRLKGTQIVDPRPVGGIEMLVVIRPQLIGQPMATRTSAGLFLRVRRIGLPEPALGIDLVNAYEPRERVAIDGHRIRQKRLRLRDRLHRLHQLLRVKAISPNPKMRVELPRQEIHHIGRPER